MRFYEGGCKECSYERAGSILTREDERGVLTREDARGVITREDAMCVLMREGACIKADKCYMHCLH